MSDPQNPYQAPQADVYPQAVVEGGSIEATLAGRADLRIGACLGEAWDRLKGAKRILLGGLLLFYVVLGVVFTWGLGFVLRVVGIDSQASMLWSVIAQLVIAALIYPFIASVVLTSARHMAGQEIAFTDLFANYGKAGKLLAAGVLVQLLSMVGFVLLIVPGIYLSVAYLLTGALIAERDMGVWEAMETSRKLVTKHWLAVFLIGIVATLATVVSAMFLLVPLIWTLPWTMLCFGVVYRNLAGVLAR